MSNPTSSGEHDEFEPPTDFTDTYYFPPFTQLQSEQHLGQPLYEDGETWCLLAEIDAASSSPGNPFCLVVHDRKGDNLIVGFDLTAGVRFVPSQFKPGHTIAIVYAKRHNFVDGTKGVRVADMKTCRAFPAKLDRLLEMNRALCDYWDTLDEEGEKKKCHACGNEGADLEECTDCSFYYYCNKECKRTGWDAKKHKLDCEMLKDQNMQALLRINATGAKFEFVK